MSVASPGLKRTKYYIWSVISIAIMFLFGILVPPFAGITTEGVKFLGIFIGVLVASIGLSETLWPALMGMAAMVALGLYTPTGLFGAWFGNNTIQQIIWIGTAAAAVRATGAFDVVAKKLLSFKFLRNHPMRMLIACFAGVMVTILLVGAATTVLLIWYPILDSLCDNCKIKRDSDLHRVLTLGIYLSMTIIYALPFRGIHLSSIALASGLMEASGLAFNDATYLAVGSIVVVLFIAAFVLMIRFVWKVDLTPLKDFDFDALGLKPEEIKMDKKQKLLTILFLIIIAYTVICAFAPKEAAIRLVYDKLGMVWLWIVMFCVFCILREKDGAPMVSGMRSLQLGVLWNIIAIGGCLTLCGTAIASDDYGIKAAISEVLKPVLGSNSWPIIVIFCVALCTLFTNFTNGMPVSFTMSAVCIPVACELQKTGAGNATVLAAGIIVSSMCAFLTYGAVAYAPIMLGREGMNNKFMFTKGAVTMVLYIVLTSAICILLGYIF